MMTVDGDDVNDWTPHLLCRFNCVGGSQSLDGASSRNAGQPLPHAVKRQLDLNIVLSNYIRHRLEKDD